MTGNRFDGVVFANELLDNLPFRVVERRDATWWEVRVAVEGTGANASVVATVSDDGKGFSGSRKESGLRNLRDRAASVGGSCEIESGVGAGTVVRWRAPLDGSAG